MFPPNYDPDAPEPEPTPRFNTTTGKPWRPAKRPGKGRGMIRERENQQAKGDPNQPIRCVPLNEDQITEMRKQNASCDLAIADALGTPASVTVWTAHGQRSSLFIVVITPHPGTDEEPSVAVDYVDGGTEWDRKQKLRGLVAETVVRGKELGFQTRML